MKKIITIGCITYLFLVFAIYFSGLAREDFSADYAIVYGNTVHENGEPSVQLKARMAAALKLYHSDRVEKIIVSGGLGKEGHDEATVMARYMVDQGVVPQDVLVDSKGYNSHATSFNAAELVGIHASVVAVSQHYHIARTRLSLRHAGFSEVYGYYPEYYTWKDFFSVSREIPALVKYWLMEL
ncbi:YdcF family protein [Oceanospirillum sp. HFRX-1_2]